MGPVIRVARGGRHCLRKLRTVFEYGRLGDRLLEIGNDALQLHEAAILLQDFTTQSHDFVVEIFTGLFGIKKLVVGRIVFALESSSWGIVCTDTLQLVGAFPWYTHKN
jgi:hypothetical protein